MARSDEPSVVQPYGLYDNTCGYCKSTTRTSISYGLRTESLSVYDYQELLDRGWRRSGKFLYKPQMDVTCCPSYTIRLKAELFRMSKEQRRVMNRMKRYLDGTYSSSDYNAKMDTSDKRAGDMPQKHEENPIENKDDIAVSLSNITESAVQSIFFPGKYPTDLEIPKVHMQTVTPIVRKRAKLSEDIAYTCNVAFPFAAMILKHKDSNTILKTIEESMGSFEIEIPSNSVKKILPECLANMITLAIKYKQDELNNCGFRVEASKGFLNFHTQSSRLHSQDSVSDSHSAEKDENETENKLKENAKCSAPQSQNKHVLEMRTKRSEFDPAEFALYKRYQIAVHHDKPEDVNVSSYVRFLVDSPLKYVAPTVENGFCGFGSFHQQYWIDGRLVAVGVVDILPSCLSSKYLFWDPDLAFLSLGKYSALQEIEWVNQTRKLCPTVEYYYLGYYIDSCPKMRYKGAYRPSELLCPVKYKWVPFDVAQPLIHKQPFVCLTDALDQIQNHQQSSGFVIQTDIQKSRGSASSSEESQDVSNVLLKIGERYLQFKNLQTCMGIPQKIMDALASNLKQYCQVVGPGLSKKMAYAIG